MSHARACGGCLGERHVTLRPASTPSSTARGVGACASARCWWSSSPRARGHSCGPRSRMRASAFLRLGLAHKAGEGPATRQSGHRLCSVRQPACAQRSRWEGSGPVALATECARTGAAPLIHLVSHSGGLCMGGGRRRPLGGRQGHAHAGVCQGAACQTGLAAWLSGCTGSVEVVMPHQLLVCASITTWLHI